MRKLNGTRLLTKMVLMAAFFLVSTVTVYSAEYVNVTKDGVNLRSGPDTKYSVIYELPEGYPLKVLTRKGQWIKVSDFENDEGWNWCLSTTSYNGDLGTPGTTNDPCP